MIINSSKNDTPVTKLSELINDAGFITSYTETDPTVPSWAKSTSKPSYTAAEVGAVPTSRTINGKSLNKNISLTASDVGAATSSAIPTKLSQLTNDTDFVTKAYMDEMISASTTGVYYTFTMNWSAHSGTNTSKTLATHTISGISFDVYKALISCNFGCSTSTRLIGGGSPPYISGNHTERELVTNNTMTLGSASSTIQNINFSGSFSLRLEGNQFILSSYLYGSDYDYALTAAAGSVTITCKLLK